MKQVITPEEFFSAWIKYSKYFIAKNPTWRNSYSDFSGWTKTFFSEKLSSRENSPLGNFFSKEFKHLGLCYRTEEYYFDLVITTHQNYLPKFKEFYPIYYDVVLEHENYIGDCWRELTKLTHIDAGLKILITYHKNSQDPDQVNRELEMVKNWLNQIIIQREDIIKETIKNIFVLVGFIKDNHLTWNLISRDMIKRSIC